ncbi:hypothetical protein Y032_0033g2743 [Ancylostoma ceylanicum]|uniref:Uncharacterized protein n=1 Tax=Ancylostoma ceylanicum TaxID=53326 RepID=A0A016UNV7_9BILA|nr:hypothetical protein Y032_0033g2743 [Ancylostoma ceylanicum]
MISRLQHFIFFRFQEQTSVRFPDRRVIEEIIQEISTALTEQWPELTSFPQQSHRISDAHVNIPSEVESFSMVDVINEEPPISSYTVLSAVYY